MINEKRKSIMIIIGLVILITIGWGNKRERDQYIESTLNTRYMEGYMHGQNNTLYLIDSLRKANSMPPQFENIHKNKLMLHK